MLTEAERYEIVVEWNGTEREYGESKQETLLEMLEDEGKRSAEAVAVV